MEVLSLVNRKPPVGLEATQLTRVQGLPHTFFNRSQGGELLTYFIISSISFQHICPFLSLVSFPTSSLGSATFRDYHLLAFPGAHIQPTNTCLILNEELTNQAAFSLNLIL